MREKVTACITTLNEERNIRRCLESVKWCDEIIVVDSFSTDRTIEICREFTDRVYQHKWQGYIGQKNVVRGYATHPWLLFIDADEELSRDLRDEINRCFDDGHGTTVGYEFPRMVNYLGVWILHGEWYPDVKLRLFHRDRGRSTGQEPHDRVEVDGPVKRLRGHLLHYTYDDVNDQLDTLNRFSGITAMEKFRAGEKFHWTDFMFRPLLRFIKAYILKMGFLDGRRGFIIACISSFGVAMKYTKLWEHELRRDHKLFNDEVRKG